MARPEVQRQCERCAHQWWAERFLSKPGGTGWSSSMTSLALHGNGAPGEMIRKQDQQRRWERFALCPQCGTKKVRTVPPLRTGPSWGERIDAFFKRVDERQDAQLRAQKEKRQQERQIRKAQRS